MSNPIIAKLKSFFNTEVKFKDLKDSEGNNLRITEDENGKPTKVEIIAEDGTLTAPVEGDITMEDGSILTVDAEGNVTKVTDAPVEDAAKTDETSGKTETAKAIKFNVSIVNKVNFKDFSAYATDKEGKMIYTTDETFEIGSPVFTFDIETYEMIPATANIETARGSIYTIVDGKITTIEKSGEAPEVEAKTEDLSKTDKQIADLTEAVNFLAEKLGKLEIAKKEIETKKEDEVVKLNKTMKELMAENEKLSKQPAGTPISTKKIEKTEFKKSSSLSDLLANNKKPENK